MFFYFENVSTKRYVVELEYNKLVMILAMTMAWWHVAIFTIATIATIFTNFTIATIATMVMLTTFGTFD